MDSWIPKPPSPDVRPWDLQRAAAGYAFWGTRRNDMPTGRIVLDYWEKWTGHEAAAMQAVVDAFNASQDRWWVNYLSVGGLDRKAKIAIAAEDPPDLLDSTATFLSSGAPALLSLESLGRTATTTPRCCVPFFW